MSADRDTPRGPTATELRRRALAHERPDLASTILDAREAVADMPYETRAEREARVAAFGAALQVNARRCDYCGALSPAGCQSSACGYYSDTPTESETRGETMAPRESDPAGDGSQGRTADWL